MAILGGRLRRPLVGRSPALLTPRDELPAIAGSASDPAAFGAEQDGLRVEGTNRLHDLRRHAGAGERELTWAISCARPSPAVEPTNAALLTHGSKDLVPDSRRCETTAVERPACARVPDERARGRPDAPRPGDRHRHRRRRVVDALREAERRRRAGSDDAVVAVRRRRRSGAHHQRLGLGDEFRRKQTCDRPCRVVADAQRVAGRTWRLSRVVRRVAAGGAPVAIRVRADVRRAALRAARTRTLVLEVRVTATAANGATRTATAAISVRPG